MYLKAAASLQIRPDTSSCAVCTSRTLALETRCTSRVGKKPSLFASRSTFFDAQRRKRSSLASSHSRTSCGIPSCSACRLSKAHRGLANRERNDDKRPVRFPTNIASESQICGMAMIEPFAKSSTTRYRFAFGKLLASPKGS